MVDDGYKAVFSDKETVKQLELSNMQLIQESKRDAELEQYGEMEAKINARRVEAKAESNSLIKLSNIKEAIEDTVKNIGEKLKF